MGDASEYRFIADAGMGGVSSVVATLPSAFLLGESRSIAGIKYRLCCNASTVQANPGTILSPVFSAGAYSVATGGSASFAHMGAVLVVHATATTGSFFWGAVYGYSAMQVGSGTVSVLGPQLKVQGDNTSVPTGSAFYISANGAVTVFPASVITGNIAAGINVGRIAAATVTTGAASGDIFLFLE